MTLNIDPPVQATRLITQATVAYADARKALSMVSDRAAVVSTRGREVERRAVYQELRDLGERMRLAERQLLHATQKGRGVLRLADMENITKKLDPRDGPDSAWSLVKAALTG